MRHTKVSETLDLVQKTVPIGVLMVIFESRPDALPQVASLAISSANGLLLKGGKEAINTNTFLLGIVKEALGQYGCADSIAMVNTIGSHTNKICLLPRPFKGYRKPFRSLKGSHSLLLSDISNPTICKQTSHP